MPNKSFGSSDFETQSRPGYVDETKDLTVNRVDFKPEKEDKPYIDRPTHTKYKGNIEVRTASFSERPNRSQPTVHARSHSAEVLGDAVKQEYQYGKLGLILGLATIIGGIILGLNGVAGSTSWTAKLLGLESKINDAAPGVVLFVVGIFFVYITKPRVKLGDLKG